MGKWFWRVAQRGGGATEPRRGALAKFAGNYMWECTNTDTHTHAYKATYIIAEIAWSRFGVA